MHGYFLQLNNAKMAKSKGDFIRLETLVEEGFSTHDYRYYCLTAHYRTQMSFSLESLDASRTALARMRQTAYDWGEPGEISEEYLHRFVSYINDDLNMPRALAVVWEMIRSDLADEAKKATLLKVDEVMGLDIGAWHPDAIEAPAEVMNLLQERELARTEKHWQRADELRDMIAEYGYVIEDTGNGPKLSR